MNSEDDRLRLTRVEHQARGLRTEVLWLWLIVVVVALAVAAGAFFR